MKLLVGDLSSRTCFSRRGPFLFASFECLIAPGLGRRNSVPARPRRLLLDRAADPGRRGAALTGGNGAPMNPHADQSCADAHRAAAARDSAMKVRNSLKSLRGRHRDNRLVRRKGRVYVINKTQRRFKARQG